MLQRLKSKLFGSEKTLLDSLPAQPWTGEQNKSATKEDIYFCFRLILGRLPNREEWTGHSSRAGEPLQDVVKTYVNSHEFKARELTKVSLPAGIIDHHNGRFIVYADQNDPVLGAPALAGVYEPSVASVIEDLLHPGDQFLDVGANLGYFSLLGATRVGPTGTVYAVEPNEHNVKLLESSRKANNFANMTVMQVAASDTVETLFLHALVGNGSTSTPKDQDSLFAARTIPGLPLDLLLAHRPKPVTLIKIDVEGFEYKALMGARRILGEDRPNIVFEFQGSGLAGIGGLEFLRWLEGFGYSFVNISAHHAGADPQVPEAIMDEYHQAAVDHIDVLARQDATG